MTASAPIGQLVAGVLSTGVKPPQMTYKGDNFDSASLYCRVAVTPRIADSAGTSSVSVSTTDTTLTDTRVSWTVNEWVGNVVSCGGKTMMVTSNTATVLTGTGGWSGGGNPGNGIGWIFILDGIIANIRKNGSSIGTVTILQEDKTGSAAVVESIADGDYFDINITQVGDTPNEGSDLVWVVVP